MKIVFMGTPQAAVPSLERLLADGHEVVAVYTQPERPSGRGNKIAFSPVKSFAVERGLNVFQPLKIKLQEEIDLFRSHSADVAVVVAYGRILPEPYLTAFDHGAINVHFSLLPKYRGAAPVNWAIVNGEAETGVTTMKMDEGLDTGNILIQKITPIGQTETSVELMQRLSLIGADTLAETLADLDKIQPKPQDEAAATYAPLMKKEDGRVDWTLIAEQISNRVRGFQPFPASFTFYGGARLTICDASTGDRDDSIVTPEPGTIISVRGDEMQIACGGCTTLALRELQPEGKRRMSVRDYINGVHPEVGQRLG